MKRIKNLVSFIHPILIESRNGTVTDYLEVMQSNGQYVLNSHKANYSFGGVHTIFDKLFQKTNIKQYDIKNVLVLGMGAGSVIRLLQEKYCLNCPVTAVEKDKVVIELAKKYFNIEKYKALTIVNADAFDYVTYTENKYDLIISDLFIEADVPEIFASNSYLKNLKRISNTNVCIIYNKMTESPVHKKELADLSDNFERIFPGSEIHKLYVNESENSILFNNTLPVFKESEIMEFVKEDQE
jgi:spermidine synthase